MEPHRNARCGYTHRTIGADQEIKVLQESTLVHVVKGVADRHKIKLTRCEMAPKVGISAPYPAHVRQPSRHLLTDPEHVRLGLDCNNLSCDRSNQTDELTGACAKINDEAALRQRTTIDQVGLQLNRVPAS